MKLLPQRAWFGLTRNRLRLAGWTIVALSTLCVVLYGAARITQWLEYRRAGSFLTELKNIQLGQSEVSVMPFMRHYQGVRADEVPGGVQDDSYALRIDPWHLMHRFPGPTWVDGAYRSASSGLAGWRRALKLRGWIVTGWVRFANGKVETVSVEVILEGENEWLLADWEYGAEIPRYLLVKSTDQSIPDKESRYQSHWTHLHFGDETGEGVKSFVTPLSTAEQFHAAQSINLQCLMIGPGCHSLCDMVPTATRHRREHNVGGWGWNSGAWGKQPHDCP
jgi:hypothetical protein